MEKKDKLSSKFHSSVLKTHVTNLFHLEVSFTSFVHCNTHAFSKIKKKKTERCCWQVASVFIYLFFPIVLFFFHWFPTSIIWNFSSIPKFYELPFLSCNFLVYCLRLDTSVDSSEQREQKYTLRDSSYFPFVNGHSL